MKLLELATRIANFIWDLDPYDLPFKNVGELIWQTIEDLNGDAAGLIADFLNECETEPEYAQTLAKEVERLCLLQKI